MSGLFDIFESETAIATLLFEGQDYDSLFNPILKFINAVNVDRGKEVLHVKTIKDGIDDMVRNTRRVLKKQDRIVWFLRWCRLSEFAVFLTPLKNDPVGIQSDFSKMVSIYSHQSGLSEAEVLQAMVVSVNYLGFLKKLEHFLSLPIAAIQNYSFGFKPILTVLNDFKRYEDIWKEGTKNTVPVDPNAKAILTFPDGFAWYDLKKAACSKEANAMGHCGNEPGRHSGDTILSLRATIQHGGHTFLKPYLTFILDRDGMLGEMKGRYNEKPEPEFHEKIMALLKLPIIHGIKGGGYKPENNFSMKDLSDGEREEVVEANSALGSLWDLYTQEGLTRRVENRVNGVLHTHHVTGVNFEKRTADGDILLDEWTNFEHFVKNVDDNPCKGIYKVIDDINDGTLKKDLIGLIREESPQFGGPQHKDAAKPASRSGHSLVDELLDDRTIDDIIDRMPAPSKRKLIRILQPQSPKTLARTLRANQEVFWMLRDAAIDSADFGFSNDEKLDEWLEVSKQRLEARLHQYIEIGYNFHGDHQHVQIKDLESAVQLTIRESDLIAMVSEGSYYEDNNDHEDYEYGYAWISLFHDSQTGSWTNVNWDVVDRLRNESDDSDLIVRDKHRSYQDTLAMKYHENDVLHTYLEDMAAMAPEPSTDNFELTPSDKSGFQIDAHAVADKFAEILGYH